MAMVLNPGRSPGGDMIWQAGSEAVAGPAEGEVGRAGAWAIVRTKHPSVWNPGPILKSNGEQGGRGSTLREAKDQDPFWGSVLKGNMSLFRLVGGAHKTRPQSHTAPRADGSDTEGRQLHAVLTLLPSILTLTPGRL